MNGTLNSLASPFLNVIFLSQSLKRVLAAAVGEMTQEPQGDGACVFTLVLLGHARTSIATNGAQRPGRPASLPQCSTCSSLSAILPWPLLLSAQ